MSIFECSPKDLIEEALNSCRISATPAQDQVFIFRPQRLPLKAKSSQIVDLQILKSARMSLKKAKSSSSLFPSQQNSDVKDSRKTPIQQCLDGNQEYKKSIHSSENRQSGIHKKGQRVLITYQSPSNKKSLEIFGQIPLISNPFCIKQSINTQPSLTQIKQHTFNIPGELVPKAAIDSVQLYLAQVSTIQENKKKQKIQKPQETLTRLSFSKVEKRKKSLSIFNPKQINTEREENKTEKDSQYSFVVERQHSSFSQDRQIM